MQLSSASELSEYAGDEYGFDRLSDDCLYLNLKISSLWQGASAALECITYNVSKWRVKTEVNNDVTEFKCEKFVKLMIEMKQTQTNGSLHNMSL